MKKHLKVGILGSGYMAKTHAQNLLKLPDIEVTAVSSSSPESAKAFAAAFPTVKAYDTFELMLEKAAMDVLFVCIPPFAHQGQIEAAAQKGIHIFNEKPIALDIARGASMTAAVKKAGVISQVGYHMRFGSAVKELKQLIDDGTAGIPTLFDGRWDCNSFHSPWWRDVSKSGGQVFEQVIHTYDMAMHLLGDPLAVSGFTANLCHDGEPTYTVEDTSVSAIRFKTGALANITGSNCAVPMEWNHTFTVVCKNLTAYFSNPNQAEFVFTNRETALRQTAGTDCDFYFEEVKTFIGSIRGECPQVCTMEEGYRSLCLVDAVKKSAEAGGMPVFLGQD